MIYSDTQHRWRNIAILAIILVMVVAGVVWRSQLSEFLSSRTLLSQVVPITTTDQNYLLGLTDGLAPFFPEEVASAEKFQQRLIETLFTHADEFDETDANAAENYLKDYYAFTEPIPAGVQENINNAVSKFVQSFPLLNQSTDFSPLINQILTILANHQISTNNYQSVKRSQTTKALLEAFAEQL